MFRTFESVLEELDISFLKRPGSTDLEGEVGSPRYKDKYRVVFKEEQGFHVSALCVLPPVEQKVKDYAKLIQHIGRQKKDLMIEFNTKHGQFSVGAYLAPASYQEDLEAFRFSLDVLIPLLILVGQTSQWNWTTIDIMLLEPHRMYQA